jgi:uncharacterized protein (TIGR02996 family)
MSTDLLGLLAEARNNPDDDTPRLILADWLEEQPDPTQRALGEFIHLQCRLSLLAEDDPQRGEHTVAAGRLLTEHRPFWLAGLPEKNCAFERGLVRLTVPATNLPRLLAWEKEPTWRWVASLQVTALDDRTTRWLASWPGLARVGSLELVGGSSFQRFAPADPIVWAATLAESPHLAQLASLCLDETHLGEGVRKLAASPFLVGLVSLDLAGNGINDEGAAVLAAANLPRLRRLGLADNVLRAAGAEHLIHAPWMRHLRSLDLGRNILGPAGARLLAGAAHLTALTHLDLRLNGVRNEGARALIDSPLADRLHWLNLVGNGIVDEEVKALLRQLGDRVAL